MPRCQSKCLAEIWNVPGVKLSGIVTLVAVSFVGIDPLDHQPVLGVVDGVVLQIGGTFIEGRRDRKSSSLEGVGGSLGSRFIITALGWLETEGSASLGRVVETREAAEPPGLSSPVGVDVGEVLEGSSDEAGGVGEGGAGVVQWLGVVAVVAGPVREIIITGGFISDGASRKRCGVSGLRNLIVRQTDVDGRWAVGGGGDQRSWWQVSAAVEILDLVISAVPGPFTRPVVGSGPGDGSLPPVLVDFSSYRAVAIVGGAAVTTIHCGC